MSFGANMEHQRVQLTQRSDLGRKRIHAPDSEADTLTAAEPDRAALPARTTLLPLATVAELKAPIRRRQHQNPGVPGQSPGSSAGAAAGQRQAAAGGA